MNELMVKMKNGGYFYFRTYEQGAKEALEDFLYRLRIVGINYDNAEIESATLRSRKYEDIDEVKY